MIKKKTILVAPLHWGLGHAARCIPIIRELLKYNYNVLLASDGAALLFLRKEFPKINAIELPSYNITYPINGKLFKWHILRKLPIIMKVISSEKKIIEKLVSEGKIDGIISDNRFGVRNSKIPSVYITHQLNVLTGNTTFFSSREHQKLIKKFDECWVPDVKGSINLSGNLGHILKTDLKLKYIGPLSRMKKNTIAKKYDVLLLLSGPEPQRSLLEEKLIIAFKGKEDRSVLLIQGIVENKQEKHIQDNITVYNYMNSNELEQSINSCDLIISRSGYSTIMDLNVLGKKAFFIPTPGQFEQEYLAKRLKRLEMFPSCDQDDFNCNKLDEIKNYNYSTTIKNTTNFEKLFRLFESK